MPILMAYSESKRSIELGWVELKIINRGVIIVEQRGHERGSVVGRHVFECVLVQRGTAMHNGFSVPKVRSIANCCCGSAQWVPIELIEHGNGHSNHHCGALDPSPQPFHSTTAPAPWVPWVP